MLVTTTTVTTTQLETLTAMTYCHSHDMMPVVPAVAYEAAEGQQGYDIHPPSRKYGK